MKRTLTVVSAALVALALASPAEAAPQDTPARMCSLGTVDLNHPPLGFSVDAVHEAARRLGLNDPEALGLGCEQEERTDPYSEVQPYPNRGPVVLRSKEPGKGSTQLYCTDSVAVFGKILETVPVETLVVIGTGCTVEVNPIVI
ncbi:hypothetical protein [Streptomyces sp. ML-6]|uniref:hypothetical protein n=1 Tax=Streptomyces sp. ML-6 TaxID=2982693 RepID=UPI0024BF8CAE|nr:hypothetical protein [Streptomyces sp. ML-6]MDK0524341.1 hypothetical protein [Streptomyces sp. ML-6]